MKNRISLPAGALLCLSALVVPTLSAEAQEAPAKAAAEAVPAPPDVGAVPADATRTASGLAYRLLDPGTGKARAHRNDLVKVHFTGWNPAGELLESSRSEGQPREFQVSHAAPGVAEALQLLTVGGKMRLWLPSELAVLNGSRPQGPVVYEIELLDLSQAPEPPGDLAAVPADAQRAQDLPPYKVISQGRGAETPGDEDRVLVNYTVWTTDGEISASSVRRGVPEQLALPGLDDVIAGHLKQMRPGERRRIWVPRAQAPRGGPKNRDLVWDMELVAFFGKPSTPPDVAAVPDDAQRTSSGLAYKVLRPGTGHDSPGADDTVVIYYSSWTPQGVLVDSAFKFGKPIAVHIAKQMPPGLVEGLGQMVVGEKRRFWIPAELSFPPSDTVPAGMLVFEVELLQING